MSRSFDARQTKTTLFDALVDARQAFGAKKPILEDQDRNPLSYTDLIRASFALGRKIAGFTKPGERVGVMLPASSGVEERNHTRRQADGDELLIEAGRQYGSEDWRGVSVTGQNGCRRPALEESAKIGCQVGSGLIALRPVSRHRARNHFVERTLSRRLD